MTTISTPHRGSPFADYVIDNVIGRERLQQLLSVMTAMDLPNSGDGAAFTALGTRAMKEFNTEVIDRDDIKYYSWGARYDPGLFDTFRWPWSVIYEKEGPNDGMVSVSSAQWGEYRGTLLDVNHLDLVGWVNQMRYMMSSLTGKPISFKPATFYLEMVGCPATVLLTIVRLLGPAGILDVARCSSYSSLRFLFIQSRFLLLLLHLYTLRPRLDTPLKHPVHSPRQPPPPQPLEQRYTGLIVFLNVAEPRHAQCFVLV